MIRRPPRSTLLEGRRQRQMCIRDRVSIPHALGGQVPQVASPIRLSETPVEYRRAPPLLGEHTEAVLADVLGLGAEDVGRLRAAGVL